MYMGENIRIDVKSGNGVEWVGLVHVAGSCIKHFELLQARNFVTGLETSIPNKNFSRSAGLVIYVDNVALSEVLLTFFISPVICCNFSLIKIKKTL